MTTHDTNGCTCKTVHTRDGGAVGRCANTRCPVHGTGDRATRDSLPRGAEYRDVAGGNDYR